MIRIETACYFAKPYIGPLLRSKSKPLEFVRSFLKGNLTVVLILVGPDQPVFLVWKASEETHLVKPLVHALQVVVSGLGNIAVIQMN